MGKRLRYELERYQQSKRNYTTDKREVSGMGWYCDKCNCYHDTTACPNHQETFYVGPIPVEVCHKTERCLELASLREQLAEARGEGKFITGCFQKDRCWDLDEARSRLAEVEREREHWEKIARESGLDPVFLADRRQAIEEQQAELAALREVREAARKLVYSYYIKLQEPGQEWIEPIRDALAKLEAHDAAT